MTDHLAQSWEDCARHVEAGGTVEWLDTLSDTYQPEWAKVEGYAAGYRLRHSRKNPYSGTRRLLPIPVTSWEQCAAHVEAGGVVELQGPNGRWLPEKGDYRDFTGSPTDRLARWPRRLVPIISAAPTPESSTDTGEGEAQAATGEGHDSAGECSGSPASDQGGLDLDRMLERAKNDGFRVSADGLAFDPDSAADVLNAALERIIHLEAPSALPEVPDGHEIVVLPRGAVDEYAGTLAWVKHTPTTQAEIQSAARAAVERRPKKLETERVPWWEAAGRIAPDGRRINEVRHHRNGSPTAVTNAPRPSEYPPIATDGTVEVLALGGES